MSNTTNAAPLLNVTALETLTIHNYTGCCRAESIWMVCFILCESPTQYCTLELNLWNIGQGAIHVNTGNNHCAYILNIVT